MSNVAPAQTSTKKTTMRTTTDLDPRFFSRFRVLGDAFPYVLNRGVALALPDPERTGEKENTDDEQFHVAYRQVQVAKKYGYASGRAGYNASKIGLRSDPGESSLFADPTKQVVK